MDFIKKLETFLVNIKCVLVIESWNYVIAYCNRYMGTVQLFVKIPGSFTWTNHIYVMLGLMRDVVLRLDCLRVRIP
jgi:hypothetical protein